MYGRRLILLRSPLSLVHSNRTDELTDLDPLFAKNFGYNPTENPNNIRGKKTNKDTYMTMSVSYSYVLRGKSSFYRGRYGNFFNNIRRRSKVKTIRAKF